MWDERFLSVEGFATEPTGTVTREGRRCLPVSQVAELPDGFKVRDGIGFVDLAHFREFQSLRTPPGWYWCEFYGGESEYRCFLIPDTLRRAEFFQLDRYRAFLDDSFSPVYQAGGFYVRQDPTHAMPGFYVVSPDRGFVSTDKLDLERFLVMRFLDHEVGKAMQELFGIQSIFRVNEERKVKYQNVHTWLLPIDDLEGKRSILEWNALSFMIRFSSWRKFRDRIQSNNSAMRLHLVRKRLRERAESLSQHLRAATLDARERSPNALAGPPADPDPAEGSVLYSFRGIEIRNHPAGIPGFLSVVPQMENGNPTEMEQTVLYLRMRFIEYALRVGMRERLGVEYAYKLQEGASAGLSPIHILPISDIARYDRIYHFVIADYIREHGAGGKPSSAAAEAGMRLRQYLADIRLRDQDLAFSRGLDTHFRRRGA